MTATNLLMDRQMLRLYLQLQVAIAIASPEHLDHLKLEGRENCNPHELMEHFCGLWDEDAATLFRDRYRQVFFDNWDHIRSNDNLHYAKEYFDHSPEDLETALYYFATTGQFRLKKEMIPAILSALKEVKPS